MKKIILFFLFITILPGCKSSDTPKQIKKEIHKEYSTKLELGDIIKDTLSSQSEIGYYKSGTQSYIVYQIGWNKIDTTFYKNDILKEKIKGNKTFNYNNKGILQNIIVKKNDTTFVYLPEDLAKPFAWLIIDGKGVLKKSNNIYSTDAYLNRKFNQYGYLIYSLIKTKTFDRISYRIIENIYEYY